MRLPLEMGFHFGQRFLVRLASYLVPRADRPDWLREWQAELWHARSESTVAGSFSWRVQMDIIAFCAGSFPDAIEVRRLAAASRQPASLHESAGQCLLCLCAVLVLCVIPAQLLTGVRAEYDSARFQLRPALISIGLADSSTSLPTVTFAQYRTWQTSRQQYFDNLGFYRVTAEFAGDINNRFRSLRVAHASANLLSILDLPVQWFPTSPDEAELPAIVLTREAWSRDFDDNPSFSDGRIQIGNRTFRIAGVVSYGSWQLPGQPEAWLIESSRDLALAGSSHAHGFVIAQLSPLGRATMAGDHVAITDNGSDASELDGTTFAQPIDGPLRVFAFALFLALLALPAVTSISMSDSSFSSHRPSFWSRFWRWGLLAAKFILSGCIAYFASCDLAYWNLVGFSPMAEFSQFAFAFLICLFTFRWALLDQRHRCPVCLRRVTHPAQVGTASCTFLGWNGTEMICTGGHTLLHVPSLPTSWFGAQRWMYLDASWEFLFAGGDLPGPA